MSHTRPITVLALGRSYVFTGDGAGNIASWSLEDGQPAGTWSAHTARISILGVADDWLFSGSDDGTAAIWDRSTRQLLAFYRNHPSGVRDLLWDGDNFLTLGRNGRIVYQTVTGDARALALPPVLAFATDAGRLLIATSKALILLSEGEPRAWPCPESIGIVAIRGSSVFAATPTALHRWDDSGEHQKTAALTAITDLSLFESELIAASAEHVTVLDAATLEPIRYFFGHQRPVVSVAVDHTGIWSASADRRVRHWLRSECQVRPPMRQRGAMRAICTDGEVVVSGGRDSSVYTWSPTAGTLLDKATPSDASVEALCLSARWLVAGYSDGAVIIWDRSTRACISTTCPAPVTSAVILGNDVVIGARDGRLRIYSCTDGANHTSWAAHEKRVRSLAAHSDGTVAVASYDHTVSLWREHLCIRRIAHHTASVTRVAFREDGALATGSMDETVRVYSGDTELTLGDHRGGVTALIWTPDGLVTADKAGRIRCLPRLWLSNLVGRSGCRSLECPT